MIRVADIMTSPVQTCDQTDSLQTAAEIMERRSCGCVPVTDEATRVVGVITDRDICIAAAGLEHRPLRQRGVAAVMSSRLRVCQPNQSVEDAVEIMRQQSLRRLPVVDDRNRLIGMLSLHDLVLHESGLPVGKGLPGLTSDEIAATLAAICGHR